jgi:hypothetical protein
MSPQISLIFYSILPFEVEKCTFYSDETLRNMMDEMQNIFATSFGMNANH